MKISRETKIGVFVVVVLVATFFVLNYLRGEDIFGKQIELHSYYDSVEGLVPSAPVYIKGYKIGSVSEVKYDRENERFYVNCSVKKKIPIPEDTRMTLYSVDIMGGKGIRLDLGTSQTLVEDGAELVPDYSPDMISSITTMLGPLMDKATATFGTVDSVGNSVNRVLGGVDEDALKASLTHLEKTLANAEKLTSLLADNSADIETLLANLKTLSSQLTVVGAKADSLMNSLNVAAEGLSKSDIEGLVNSYKELADNLNNPDGTVGKLLNDGQVYESLDSLLKDIDTLVKNIEENPKKYIRIRVL